VLHDWRSRIFLFVCGTYVDDERKKSPVQGDDTASSSISNVVAVVLTLGLLGVVVLLSLFVMGLIFIFQSVL
jgi:hypothetical protein